MKDHTELSLIEEGGIDLHVLPFTPFLFSSGVVRMLRPGVTTTCSPLQIVLYLTLRLTLQPHSLLLLQPFFKRRY